MPTTSPAPSSAAAPETTTGADDFLCIRGRRLPLGELVDHRFDDPALRASLRQQLAEAKPFPHVILKDVFNPVLLDLIHEEFDLFPNSWKAVHGKHEKTHRSVPGSALGPASQTYFNLLNSGWFVTLLVEVTGIPNLLSDPELWGGGLHETRHGGNFNVHRDFNRHHRNALHNEMVVITYLNRDWDRAWGGALELWDPSIKAKAAEVWPEFGRTLIMPHGPRSYHGHPSPLKTPEGRSRRSVASYYYSNRDGEVDLEMRKTSAFIVADKVDLMFNALHQITPPVVRTVARSLKTRLGKKKPAAKP